MKLRIKNLKFKIASALNAVNSTFSILNFKFLIIALTLLLTACDTVLQYPDCGKITVTADWSGRGDNINVPEKWHISLGEYYGEETSTIHSPDCPFAPGGYNLVAWTHADGIHISGTTATASYSDAPLGWFFTHTQPVTIEANRNHAFSAAMRQQVRMFTIVIDARGDAAARITDIEATLGGAATNLDFATDTHSDPVTVGLAFRKLPYGNQWAATIRLLGIAGKQPILSGKITFANANPLPVDFNSDLTAQLEGFNSDKRVPLTIRGTLVMTPSQTGVTTTIEKWTSLDDWNVDAY